MRALFLIILGINLLSGCSSMIGKMYQDFDRADGKVRRPKRRSNQFDFYRNRKLKNRKNNRVSSAHKKRLFPDIKRNYRPAKRIKADDLNDNSNGGSLWDVSSGDGFLFTQNVKKSSGDIILIDVEAHLKNEITAELKRAYPDKKKRSKKKDSGESSDETKSAKSDAPKKADDLGASTKDQIFDRISSIVIEEINKKHLLLRGRKFLLYKNRKRLVEIQALVPRRDITNTDTISSTSIIESTINVIR